MTVPRSGGTAAIEFTNENKDFGTIAVQKVRTTKNSGIVPFGGVEFELYKNKADVNTPSKRADYTIRTENDGNGYLNKIPVGTYYAKEITPYGYEPNEEIYEVKAVADFAKFEGFKASDGKYYGTAENPIVNETNTGMLYLGVIKWDLEGMSEREINYLLPSNQIKAVSTAYANYQLDLYYEKGGKIVRYQENDRNVTLTADKNGIIKKRLPAGTYYVAANTNGYDKNKYTPWAQNHQTVDGKYCMGSFTVKVYDDNYNLPNPDSDGVIDWKMRRTIQQNIMLFTISPACAICHSKNSVQDSMWFLKRGLMCIKSVARAQHCLKMHIGKMLQQTTRHMHSLRMLNRVGMRLWKPQQVRSIIFRKMASGRI